MSSIVLLYMLSYVLRNSILLSLYQCKGCVLKYNTAVVLWCRREHKDCKQKTDNGCEEGEYSLGASVKVEL